jgi:hypothetical protein
VVVVTDYVDADTPSSVTTATATDVQAGIDSATVESYNTPITTEVTTIVVIAFDYNWSTWSTGYTYDGSVATAGSVGPNDDDHGLI